MNMILNKNQILISLPECPHCLHKEENFRLVAVIDRRTITRQSEDALCIFLCLKCNHAVCVECNIEILNSFRNLRQENFRYIYPEPVERNAPADTPRNIADYFIHAKKLLDSISCEEEPSPAECTAPGVVLRKSLELAVEHVGGRGKNLCDKIRDLEAREIITPAMADWAHALRIIGNNSAHADEPSTIQDIKDAYWFAEALFTYLFTLPAMVERHRKHQ